MVVLMAKRKSESTAFGVRLRERREAAGLSLAALGEMVGMAKSAILRLETSPTANPTLETIRKLAEALDCTVTDLIG